MKRFVIISMLIGTFLFPHGSVSAANSYTISVTVRDIANNDFIGGVDVLITDGNNSLAAAGRTDTSGNARIILSRAGEYTVDFVKEKYIKQSPPPLVTLSDASPSVEITAYLQYTHELVQGWNFISFPKLPTNTTVEAILQDMFSDVKIVWGYDNQQKIWLKYKPSDTANTLTKIEAGKGYWFYLDKQSSLGLTGNDVSLNAQLYDGWNLTGYNGQDHVALGAALSSLGNSWSMVWNWMPGDTPVWYAAHSAIAQLPAPIRALTHLDKGKAYWINMKKDQGKIWTQPTPTSNTTLYPYANWMSYIHDTSPNMKLSELILLGSHDACSKDVSSNSPVCTGYQRSDPSFTSKKLPGLCDLANAWTQSNTVYEQLQAGVRYLDMRVALQKDCSGQYNYCAEHMWLSTPIWDSSSNTGVFTEVNNFLANNPYEVVIMVFKDDTDKGPNESHLYSDSPSDTTGYMSLSEAQTFINHASQTLPLVPISIIHDPSSPWQVALQDVWNSTKSVQDISGQTIYGGIIIVGDPSWNSQYVWDSVMLDSQWMKSATDWVTLIKLLDASVMYTWESSPNSKFHVIQAMTNDNNKLSTASTCTNPAILWQICSTGTCPPAQPPAPAQCPSPCTSICPSLCNLPTCSSDCPPPALTLPWSSPPAYPSWDTVRFNVVQVNDSVNSGMMPALLKKMGITLSP